MKHIVTATVFSIISAGLSFAGSATAMSQEQGDSAQAEQTTLPGQEELWYGILDAGSRHFRFLIQLNENEDGSYQGKLKSLDEGRRDFALDNVIRDQERFEFEIKSTKAKYSGQFDASTGTIKGEWAQRTANLPLDFKPVSEEPKQELAAVWNGELKVMFQVLEMQFRELKSGEVYFDSVSQKAGGFVAAKEVKDGTITFEVPAINGTFEGELSADGEELVGKWKQGFLSPKLSLKKIAVPKMDLPTQARPQTPKPPFNYKVEDVQFENEAAEVTLAGTLTMPERPEEMRKALILISGSGPQDRDETIEDHKPFAVIADYLTQRGIAVLRFDERGVGKSTGDFATADSRDFASDVHAAFQFLQQHPIVGKVPIGLCGHSEGGYVAPMVALMEPNVAFVIMLAGPGVTGERILVSQLRLLLKASRVPERVIESRAACQRVFLDLAMQEPPLSDEVYERRALQDIQEFLTDGEKEIDVGKAMVSAAAAQLRTPWFQFFIRHDPAADLRKLSCPVLALNGSKDLQIDPDLNLPVIRQALEAAPTSEFDVVELPGLNHLFQNAETGLVQEYGQITETFDTDTLQRIADWLLK